MDLGNRLRHTLDAARSWTRSSRGRRVERRVLPVLAVALVAFAIGAVLGAGGGGAERSIAQRYVQAWADGDLRELYGLTDADTQVQLRRRGFTAAHRQARLVSTFSSAKVGRASGPAGGRVTVPVVVRTRAFGTLEGTFVVTVADERVKWSRSLVFPGVREGERLSRRTSLPVRAALRARDGSVLAEGPDRVAEDPVLAAEVVGQLDSPPPEDRARLAALGYPPDALVGATGLERALESRLAGRPGGVLRAGRRVLARTPPEPAADVRTAIDPELERAAIDALAGRLGGIAAVDPRTGEVLALSGIAFSGLQPPGSTFKIITLTRALEEGKTSERESFGVESATLLEGVRLENADGELCGGSLQDSFAHSCNSVFAPLGAEIGAAALVDQAEKFGFNSPLPIPGAATSTIPPADEIGDDLAIGSSAIGQGKVQATALQMALVAATVANGGRRATPTLVRTPAGGPIEAPRVIPAGIARRTVPMMEAVVEYGTGTAAQIPGVAVAGKTGTAELSDTSSTADGTEVALETDAWFVAFAPARRPRIAVGVLLVQAGAGGDVAAPAARTVLAAALQE